MVFGRWKLVLKKQLPILILAHDLETYPIRNNFKAKGSTWFQTKHLPIWNGRAGTQDWREFVDVLNL